MDPDPNAEALERAPAAGESPAPKAAKPRTAIGLIPETVDQAWRLAQIMSSSELVPAKYKDKPADVMVAIMFGAEVGLTPAQALTGIAVINGRPGLYGDALLAVVISSSLYVSHEEYFLVGGVRRPVLEPADLLEPTTAAACRFIRRGDRQTRPPAVFSIADARRAHLIGKAGPWIEYPQIMLKWRARNYAARDAFPDLLRGVRAAEELEDYAPEASKELDAPAPVVRRISDAMPDPAVPIAAPAPEAREPRELEPAAVEAVAPFLDGALVHLSSGVRAVVENLEHAAELGALVGTGQQVRLTVTRGPTDELVLQSFAIS